MPEIYTAPINDRTSKSRSSRANACPPIDVQIYRDFGDLAEIRDEWDKLWEASPRRDFFDHYDWIRSVATAQGFSSTRQLCICVGKHDGEVVAILPLALESKTLRFAGAPRSDYNDLLCKNGFAESSLKAFLTRLLRVERSWTQCVFGNVPEDSTLLSVLSNNDLASEVNVVKEHASTCLALNLTCMSQSEIEQLSRKRTFRYYENRLLRRGSLTFRHLDSKKDAMEHFDRFVGFHIARRTMEGDTSVFLNEEGESLFRNLITKCDLKSDVHFSVLESDGTPVAYHLGFRTGNRLTYYKPTFDINFREYSPGQILLKKLIQNAAEIGLSEFDFTVGDSAFKRRFANKESSNSNLRLFRKGIRGTISRVNWQTKHRIKQSPRLGRSTRMLIATPKAVNKIMSSVARHGVTHAFQRLACTPFSNPWVRKRIHSADHFNIFIAERQNEQCSGESQMLITPACLREIALFASRHTNVFSPEKMARLEQRFKDGAQAWLACVDDQPVHLAWTSVGKRIVESSFGIGNAYELPRESLLIYDCWTAPMFRGHGVYPAVLDAIVKHPQWQTLEKYVWCRRNNLASRRGIEKSGFRLCARACSVRWFNRWERFNVTQV